MTQTYVSEVRFGVVMYGGVSLAIYINGVANELFELCCATPRGAKAPPGGSTREVYARVSSLLRASEADRLRYLQHGQLPATPERVRFAVDVISGTSAGGINGLFLAKSLTQGRSFGALAQLWVQEGDIGLLLNDGRHPRLRLSDAKGASFELNLPGGAAPASLLDSQRMYLKLLDALWRMDAQAEPCPPLVDDLDCYITTTDIEGAPVPLRLSDRVVYERRHRQVFHLCRSAREGSDDFGVVDSPFLAFAARCTSSFPFAFEPMTLDGAQALVRRVPGMAAFSFEAARYERHFLGLGPNLLAREDWRRRAFGDGGYLANKPFGLAARALARRSGGPELQRVLLYVEPSPEHPEATPVDDAAPDALQNAAAALLSIPQYQTIREDLDAVLARNQRIESVERIVRAAEEDIESNDGDEGSFARIRLKNGQVPIWESLDLTDMVAYYGRAFLPYRRLRVHTVTDRMTQILCDAWAVDRDGDLREALRALVWSWRIGHYVEYHREAVGKPTINAFLSLFDLEYRLRRLRFLQARLARLQRLLQQTDAPGVYDTYDAVLLKRWNAAGAAGLNPLPAMRVMQDGLSGCVQLLLDLPRRPPTTVSRDRVELQRLLEHLLASQPAADAGGAQRLRAGLFNAAAAWFRGLGRDHADLRSRLVADIEALALPLQSDALRALDALIGNPNFQVQGEGEAAKVTGWSVDAVTGVAALDSAAGQRLRHFMAEAMLRYDEYDQASFPLYYDTDTGEPSTVRVLRVSPEDSKALDTPGATLLAGDKLCGTALAHFGAFLRSEFREHDILWGRLDGAERLLAALMPHAQEEALRQRLTAEAQAAILGEALTPQAYQGLVDRFEAAFADLQGGVGKRLREQLQQLTGAPLRAGYGTDDRRLIQVLRGLMQGDALLSWFRSDRPPKPVAPPANELMGHGSRALRITGQMLKSIEQRHLGRDLAGVWLARFGLLLQGLMTVSTPGSLSLLVARHWFLIGYLFAALWFGLGWLFGLSEVRNSGLVLALACLLLHLLVHGMARWRQGCLLWLKGLLMAMAVAALGLAGYGGYALWQKLSPKVDASAQFKSS